MPPKSRAGKTAGDVTLPAGKKARMVKGEFGSSQSTCKRPPEDVSNKGRHVVARKCVGVSSGFGAAQDLHEVAGLAAEQPATIGIVARQSPSTQLTSLTWLPGCTNSSICPEATMLAAAIGPKMAIANMGVIVGKELGGLARGNGSDMFAQFPPLEIGKPPGWKQWWGRELACLALHDANQYQASVNFLGFDMWHVDLPPNLRDVAEAAQHFHLHGDVKDVPFVIGAWVPKADGALPMPQPPRRSIQLANGFTHVWARILALHDMFANDGEFVACATHTLPSVVVRLHKRTAIGSAVGVPVLNEMLHLLRGTGWESDSVDQR